MPLSQHHNPDLSRYLALGDSITAGYADGALFYEGQQHAYPNILAKQFKCTLFKQPWMPQSSVGCNMTGQARLILERDAKALNLCYAATQGDTTALQQNVFDAEGPFNNMGVPGAKATTTMAAGFGNTAFGSGNYNPFFTRMASAPATASVLQDALLADATFFTVFIGNNDALAYALSGGTMYTVTPPHGPAGVGFDGSLKKIIEALASNGAQGAIATLPNIASIPYFNAIAANGFVLEDNDAPNGQRPAAAGDLILMDVLLDANAKNYLQGKQPIPKHYNLTAQQAAVVEDAIDQYNRIIARMAIEKGLALVDINALVKTAQPDRWYNATTLSLSYSKRGVFSLDGLHPNYYGQARLANAFIKAINARFQTHIATVASHDFSGIHFPSSTTH